MFLTKKGAVSENHFIYLHTRVRDKFCSKERELV